MYANLIVDNGAGQPDRLFTYLIEGAEFDGVKPGNRLVVPFGRGSKPKDAIVWSLSDEKPDFKCKKAIAILSEEYSFTRTQLFLMAFLRSNYASTYRSAYRTIMPIGQELIVKKTYTVSKDGFLQFKYGSKLSERQVLKLIKKSEVKDLIKDGTLICEESYSIKHLRKKTLFVSSKFEDLSEVLDNLNPRAKKLQRILRYVDSHGRVEYSKLRSACSAQRADVNKLVESGFLEYSEVDKPMNIKKYYNDEPGSRPSEIELSQDQKKSLSIFDNALKNGVFRGVVNGVTGSGKTRLYIEMARRILSQGRQVLILVPEIALTAQLISRIGSALEEDVAVLHTHVSISDKVSAYFDIKKGKTNIVIGARSALFAPFNDLGLIVIDESHEKTYKSEQIPRYSAVRLAMDLSEKMDIHIALGSATTTVETFALAKSRGYLHLPLKSRIGGVSLPSISIIDMASTERAGGRISTILYEKLSEAFQNGEQAIILHNRRGHSAYRLCPECKHIEKCVNCDVSMSVSNKGGDLYCRYCDYKIRSYTSCSQCGNPVEDRMPAVKSVKEDLEDLFPDKKFVAIDSDTTRAGGEYLDILSDFESGDIDAIVGTQVIAKGLDFERVGIAAVIDADSIFHAPDYTASERAFALMYQLAGRAGRRKTQGRVYIQAIDTEHRVLKYLTENDYIGFLRLENNLRKAASFPPYSSFVSVRFVSETDILAKNQAEIAGDLIRNYAVSRNLRLKVFKATEQYYLRIKNKYNYYVLIKNEGENSQKLVKLLYNVFVANKYGILRKDVSVSLDFEPSSF